MISHREEQPLDILRCPKFSVIIPTCNRNDQLARCLDCLAPNAQTLDYKCYEVIVSDDGRSPAAEEMIRTRYPWAQWLSGPRRGPAANRNFGAKHARGEWLVFTDDDCLPSSGWLSAFWASTGFTNVLEGLTRADRERQSYAEEAPLNLTGGYLWSCNFAIRKATFENVGGFDENYPAPAMEDCDLRETLREKGFKSLFVKEAAVVHPWRPAKPLEHWEQHYHCYCYYQRKHFKVNRISVGRYYARCGLRNLFAYVASFVAKASYRDRRWYRITGSWMLKRAAWTLLFGYDSRLA
jgi:GT2 family glycosyltransferase